jgi:hypothetical protein
MSAPVTHINLLQRTGESHATAWVMAVLLIATIAGIVIHASQLRSKAQEDVRRRDQVALQVKELQARLASRQGEQAGSATALSLRKEIDALELQAQATQVLLDALRRTEGGRTEEFSRALQAMTGLNEPGLWLTTLTVSGGGKRLELQGQAANGPSVLRFARRANTALAPLTLHLDSLEMQPAEGTTAARGGVSFRLY